MSDNLVDIPVATNEYDIIRLGVPIDDKEERNELYDALAGARFQRIGKPIGIVKILEEVGKDVCEEWASLVHQYMLTNVSGTSYFYLKKTPRFYPMTADINQTLEANNVTTDSSFSEADIAFAYDIETGKPGTLTKRAFGPNKENAPRFRFFISTDKYQYKVSAQRKEWEIHYKAYAQTGKIATLMVQGLEYYFNTRREKLLDLGVQHHYVMETMGAIEQDDKTGMFYRRQKVYMKTEEWFIGDKKPVISSIDMDWQVNEGGTPFNDPRIDNLYNGGIAVPES